jgi:DNA-binding MarR family transcriptional regulator
MPRAGGSSGAASLLTRLGAHAGARFGERVQQVGLSRSQCEILDLLTANPGISQQRLAQLVGMLPSRVVAAVDAMEEAGLVRRQRDDADRRRNSLRLTSGGRAAVQKVAAVARAHEDDLCAALSSTERRQLAALLERIAAEQGLTPAGRPGYPAPRRSSTRR